MSTRFAWRAGLRAAALAAPLTAALLAAAPAAAQTVFLDQGAAWTEDKRFAFYTQDQGSRIMPLAWMRALTLPDGTPFLHGSLARYGYLPNPEAPAPDIPVGFTVAPEPRAPYGGADAIGMTCAACHTREITVNGTPFRADGGPAMVDFQAFLADLDTATAAVLASDAAFDAFATAVLGEGASETQRQTLRIDFETWQVRYHALMQGSLPDPSWGPGRLDAVSMIFNRLAGLDLGEPPTFLIEENIARADAPTRYPFLWNAARQDKTQWPGFADNGNDILGLSRNLGEVYGVFAIFHPVEQRGLFRLNRDYLSENSANFTGLRALETLIWDIGPPRWPWAIDPNLAQQGGEIFHRDTADGGCVACHGIQQGAFRSFTHTTWKTPIVDVGTDRRECEVLGRRVATGVMDGARIPFVADLGPEETAFDVLAATVIGAIIQDYVGGAGGPADVRADVQAAEATLPELEQALPTELRDLQGAFRREALARITAPQPATDGGQPESGCGYESRVLQGIWAAAPYLHNGSVPTLAELLKPASERVASFKLGPAYDIEAVGLAVEQTAFDHTLVTTGCDDLSSGDSRCGHEYGVDLSDDEKRALLEYLKTL